MKIRKKTILFTLAGAILGFIVAYLYDCPGGKCVFLSNKYIAMISWGFIGFILSFSTENEK